MLDPHLVIRLHTRIGVRAVRGEGLVAAAVAALAARLDGVRDRAERRHHDHFRVGVPRLHGFQQCRAVAVAVHPDVGDHDVDVVRGDDVHRGGAAGRLEDDVAVLLQHVRRGPPHVHLIVDEEDVHKRLSSAAGSGRHADRSGATTCADGSTGSPTVKRAPRPGSFSTRT